MSLNIHCATIMEQYPDGKLNNSDEGELRMAIGIKDGRVVIDFGKDWSWLGFDKETLRNFIDGLEEKYKDL